jgi:hypothetical protein
MALWPLVAYCTSPRWQMVIVEQLVEWRLAGETEVLGENLPQRHFVHQKSHMTRPRARTRAAAGTLVILTEFYRSFPRPHQDKRCIVPRIVHYRFLPNALQLIICESFHDSKLWSPRCWWRRKMSQKEFRNYCRPECAFLIALLLWLCYLTSISTTNVTCTEWDGKMLMNTEEKRISKEEVVIFGR